MKLHVWEDDKAIEILRDKVDEVDYPVANELINQKQFSITLSPLNSEDSVPSDESDDKEGIEVLEEDSNNIIVIL